MILCFPDPYPDEVLYSMWTRFADRVRYLSESRLLIELFGSDKFRPIIDLPCHIGAFTEKLLIGNHYTTDNLIDQHTLFPLYSPFMSQEKATILRNQMIASESRGQPKGFYRRFGIVNSLAPRMQWLRYCPECWREDRTNFGEAYWHRSHQAPGFEICPLHKTFIENSSVRMRNSFFGRLLVSAEFIEPVASPRLADSSPLCKALIGVAEDISYLLEHPQVSLSPHLFRDQYHTLLMRQGFITKGGTVRNVDLLNTFARYYTSPILYQFNCEMNQQHAHSSWLVRLVMGDTGQQPPLHHLLAIRFLEATVKDFFDQNIKLPSPFGEGPWPCLNPACERYKQKHIINCQIKHTQNKQNIPVGIFACTCGFIYSRKGPDSLLEDVLRRDTVLSYGPVWEAKLRELWINPAITRRDIGRFFSISEANVTKRAIKLCLPTPRISPYKSKGSSKLMRDTQWYRTQWLALVETLPEKGITFLRDEAPGVYIWLYNNDQDWLIAHRPPSKPWRRRGGPKMNLTFQSLKQEPLDDTLLDIATAGEVKDAAYHLLHMQGQPKRITKTAISWYASQLHQVMSKPEKVPLTIQALKECVETREAFFIRRIQWVKQCYQKEQIIPSRTQFLRRSGSWSLLRLPSVRQAYENAMTELLRPLQ